MQAAWLLLVALLPSVFLSKPPNKLPNVVTQLLDSTHPGCTVIYIQNIHSLLYKKGLTQQFLPTFYNHFSSVNYFAYPHYSISWNPIIQGLKRQKFCYSLLLEGDFFPTVAILNRIRDALDVFPSIVPVMVMGGDVNWSVLSNVVRKAVVVKMTRTMEVGVVYKMDSQQVHVYGVLETGSLVALRSFAVNPNGKQIVVAKLYYAPFFFEKGDSYDGLDARIIQTFAAHNHLNVSYISAQKGDWGKYVNGSWTGLIGLADRREVDLSTCGIAKTPERERDIDFSRYILEDGTIFVAPVPQLLPKWLALIRPFGWLTWCLIFCMLFLLSVVLYIISSLSHKINDVSTPRMSAAKSIMFCLRKISNEASPTLPNDDSSRIVCGTWMIFCLIIVYCYSGLITSFLIEPLREEPIKTTSDIIAREGLVWGTVMHRAATSVRNFEKSKAFVIQEIWKKMTPVPSEKVCAEKTAEGGFVCFGTKSGLSLRMASINARPGGPYFEMAKELVFRWLSGIVLQRGSPYKISLDNVIIRLKESGIFYKWLGELTRKSTVSTADDTGVNPALTLSHFSGVFMLLGIGLSLATISFVIGLVRYKREKN